jgi:antitoxin YefM
MAAGFNAVLPLRKFRFHIHLSQRQSVLQIVSGSTLRVVRKFVQCLAGRSHSADLPSRPVDPRELIQAVPGKERKMHVLTFSQARADLKQTMDDVCRDHEPAVITRQRGEPVVMISLEDYNGMRETMYLLESSANAKRLRASIAQLRAGKAVTQELALDECESQATKQD